MASLHTSAPPTHSIGIFRLPSAGSYAPSLVCATPAGRDSNGSLNLRFKKELQLRVKNRSRRVSASNTNPSEKSEITKSSDNASSSGPPFLTILAGLVVFLFIGWIIGSIVMFIVSLFSHPPQ